MNEETDRNLRRQKSMSLAFRITVAYFAAGMVPLAYAFSPVLPTELTESHGTRSLQHADRDILSKISDREGKQLFTCAADFREHSEYLPQQNIPAPPLPTSGLVHAREHGRPYLSSLQQTKQNGVNGADAAIGSNQLAAPPSNDGPDRSHRHALENLHYAASQPGTWPPPSLDPGTTHVWNFDAPVIANNVEGWKVINYAAPYTADGILHLTATTNMGYPDLEYRIPSWTVDPAVSKRIAIKVSNGTSNRRARFYWVKDGIGIRYNFLTSVHDTDFKEYVIDLSQDSRWSGNIESIRFEIPMPVPSDSDGRIVSVDYIKLLNAPPTPSPMPPFTLAPFGVNLAGGEFANKDYQYPHAEELDYFLAKGLTIIRVPFKWERIQPELNGPLAEKDLNELKNFVWAARTRGMWVVLDMHNYGRRQVNGTTTVIGDPGVSIADAAEAWRMIADEFKAFENIYAYGLMNEPYGMGSATHWFEIAQAMINAIRTTDTRTPIMVGGESYSSAARWLSVSDNLRHLVDPANNLIYEAHVYFDNDASGSYKGGYDIENATPDIGVNRLQPFVNWLRQHNLRGFVGEYGIPDNDPRWLVVLENALTYLKQNGVNGTYWAAGSKWGSNKLAVHPSRDGSDRPQMAVLENHLYADSTSSLAPPPPTGVGELSYWSFNETSGTTAADSWGSNSITLSSGASFASGKQDNGLKLNGTSSGYATLPNGIVSSLNDFSISGWVKADAMSANTRWFDFGNHEYSFMAVVLGRGGNEGAIRFASRTSSSSTGLQTITSSTPTTVGAWQHIAVSKNGNVGILYVNGVEVARNENLTFKPSDLGSTTKNWLGKSQWAANPYLNGIIDDFKIHSRGLTAAEIDAEFQGSTPLADGGGD